ncbi:MAG: PhzF family phenazine biosynthesis protein [Gemmatimonadetes bacterium]|nr:PhzF family phenazine biosynthesis protein [Gemmatimonadota bacterium]MBT8404994.1 PhzF family phenazine biosynthesis protein [Gemmatimonadota bacterium]NNK62218.1 PhzF family phenazine biosynthesis protein [Gemmatimonadota bacterium]
MRARYVTLDVFTDTLFGGNPLAVFPDADRIPERHLGSIARELNLSETVFVYPPKTSAGTKRVRIFTPGAEVPFAGHPTVGTAWWLVASGTVATPRDADHDAPVHIVLEEGVGPVAVEVNRVEGRPTSARLTTAADHIEWPLPASPLDLAPMLGLEAEDVGLPEGLVGQTGPLEPAFASAGLPFVVVPVRSAEAAGRARLDQPARARLLGTDPPATFVYVVAPARDSRVHLHVRMFAPEIGVPEDPATGSACAALGGYLGRRLLTDTGDASWQVQQGIEMGRPSRLALDVRVEAGRPTRVRVGGSCVLVAHAEMEIPA